ncbi:MAG: bacillithiol biosynthesis deacetylase BshB1 [Bacteroidetes bacterium]|nr:bacillithiol biosynthesis deacetylase BshB1 [Rhodothermia bacterium]MCS7155678.1 bacillithiol biosynthesis deacetylase BshB1 [Bacteroidota bacterium]MCX7906537.1 bacillithiol biosynthesis deacetylase BshB1 [Bacteroidota bacterium]MDW8137182.1 bacillithiol biosynthesis deacetylase BshB1 [Bacteroidota bacterium]MDW8284948.1 bacillithiol biosynthesis deacetylase BshB1 [Bacteroidota bacterium]
MQLDVLAFAAHPDDAELSCGGTLLKLARAGYRTGIVDLTRGELGTRGTPEIRAQEAEAAARILGLSIRENLGLPDGHIPLNEAARLAVIRVLRRYRPHLILVNAPTDRHPDHEHAARLVVEASFYAGLRRIQTLEADGTPQEPWRPHHILHYLQHDDLRPHFVVDISDVIEERLQAVRAYRSQLFSPDYAGDDPPTLLSTDRFWEGLIGRLRHFGLLIGAAYAEGFRYHKWPLPVDDLMQVLHARPPR